jgi:hypothetical protein
MKKFDFLFRILAISMLFLPMSADAQLWSENFDGSNTTNPPIFSRQCFSPKDYINVVCQNGNGCDNEIEDIFVFFDADGVTPYSGGQYLAVRDMDHQDCANNASLNETISFNGINISAGTGEILYVCFDVAEGRNINGSDADSSGNEDTWDGSSNVTISASVDGAAFTTVTAIEAFDNSNTRPGIDVNCDGKADDAGEPELTNVFTRYCFELPTSGNLLDLEIAINELNTQGEDIAFDNILVYDCAPASGTILNACTPFSPSSLFFLEDFDGSNNQASFVPDCEFNQNGDGRDYHGVTCLHDGSCPNSIDMNDDYTYFNVTGDFFGARDMNGENCNGGGNSGDTPITTTASGIDISACLSGTSIFLCFDIAESDTPNREGADTWDGNQSNPNSNSFLTFSASVDGGPATDIISFAAIANNNTGPAQDTNFDGTGDGMEVTGTFTTFCAQIPLTGASLDLSFTIGGLNTDGDDVALDNIALYCTNDVAMLPTSMTPVTACANTAPTAVCQDATVALDNTGNVMITAADVDGGTNDAEGIQSITIDPDTFDCTNVGPNTVTLTVTDFEGLTDNCTAVVTIEDNDGPTAVCQDASVSLNSNGQVAVTAADVDGGSSDACGAVTLSVSTTSFDCGTLGANAVVLTATDVSGNESTCTATVTVSDITAAIILCRPPVVGDNDPGTCGATFELLPPIVITENCSISTVSSDAPATFPSGTTTVLWTLTDAGGNDTECTQTVTIVDIDGPVADCGQPFHAYTAAVDLDNPPFPFDNSCQFPSYLLDPIQSVTDNCSSGSGTITVTNDAPQFFPPGQYTVTYTFMDESGNVGTCEQSVKVWDISVPELTSCPGDLVVEATGANGAAASWSLPTASDNCSQNAIIVTEENGLESGDMFPLGETTVTYELTDPNGNSAECSFTVTVLPADQMVAIAGMMATEAVEAVQDVEVYINGNTNTMSMTSTDGLYNFDVPMDGDYSITPVKDIEILNGVSTYDLVLIQKHILSMEILDSPYKMIAADINNSGYITTLDLVQLRKVILLIENDFPNNTSWRFIDQDFVFANPSNPFETAFPEFININNLDESMMDADFVSVKIGDVNGNAIANNLLGADDRTVGEPLVLTANNARMYAGETQTIELTANDFNQYGFQFTLNFDAEKVTFEDIESDLLESGNFGLTKLDDGAITVSWNQATAQKLANNTPVLSLTLTANIDVTIEEALTINSRFTAAEAYAADGALQQVELNFGQSTASSFKLYQNVPNPFANETSIGFDLPMDGKVVVSVMDLSGKTVFQTAVNGVQGFNKIQLTREDLPNSGVLYYNVKTENEVATGKMILID